MSSPAVAAPAVIPPRHEIAPRYTWDLSSIFASWADWERAYEELDAAIDRPQVGVAAITLDLVGVRVDREDLVAALA